MRGEQGEDLKTTSVLCLFPSSQGSGEVIEMKCIREAEQIPRDLFEILSHNFKLSCMVRDKAVDLGLFLGQTTS